MSQGVTAHDLPVCGPYSLLVLVLTLWIHQVGEKSQHIPYSCIGEEWGKKLKIVFELKNYIFRPVHKMSRLESLLNL